MRILLTIRKVNGVANAWARSNYTKRKQAAKLHALVLDAVEHKAAFIILFDDIKEDLEVIKASEALARVCSPERCVR
ncbi:hypothetical protein LCGC14_3054570 [marine sediment metagenome]|uniref:Uncharacterized protein n=1 Tax=marine sediment metagenome TaxID=412755 RepID=A0A0F8WKR1_9ZZZZ